VLLAACQRGPDADAARKSDPSITQQIALADQLAAQKDSLTQIVLETDKFITAVDSQLDRVPNLKGRKPITRAESPFGTQLQERQAMLERVQALVDRTRATSGALVKARAKIKTLETDATAAAAHSDSIITELGATVQRQVVTIQTLQERVDSLFLNNQKLQGDTANLHSEVRGLGDSQARAWVVIGTERELLDKKIIVREGGTSLLVARVGRTLQPARDLPKDAFSAIDVRKVIEIEVPDSTKRYEIVSRQSLDYATVDDRKGQSFRGRLRIADSGQFWSGSRYLILVAQ
jgi:FtsZ-binding cell division protein ZapB